MTFPGPLTVARLVRAGVSASHTQVWSHGSEKLPWTWPVAMSVPEGDQAMAHICPPVSGEVHRICRLLAFSTLNDRRSEPMTKSFEPSGCHATGTASGSFKSIEPERSKLGWGV